MILLLATILGVVGYCVLSSSTKTEDTMRIFGRGLAIRRFFLRRRAVGRLVADEAEVHTGTAPRHRRRQCDVFVTYVDRVKTSKHVPNLNAWPAGTNARPR